MTVVKFVIAVVIVVMCNFGHGGLLRLFVCFLPVVITNICHADSLYAPYMLIVLLGIGYYIYIEQCRMFIYMFSKLEKESIYVRANFH